MDVSIGGSKDGSGRMSRSSFGGWSCSIRWVSAVGGGVGAGEWPFKWLSRFLHTRVADDRRPTLERASIRARVTSGLKGRVWSRGGLARREACQHEATRNISCEMSPLAVIPARSWAGVSTAPFARELYWRRPGSSWKAPTASAEIISSSDRAWSRRCLDMIRRGIRRWGGTE